MKNYSRQRDEIVKIIQQMEKHSTAEQIYLAVKKKDSSISRSTVYRNLNDLSLNGVLLKFSTVSGTCRYELVDENEPHGHKICLNCGKIEEFFYNDDIQKIKTAVGSSDEFQDNENLSVVLIGVCSSCRKSKCN